MVWEGFEQFLLGFFEGSVKWFGRFLPLLPLLLLQLGRGCAVWHDMGRSGNDSVRCRGGGGLNGWCEGDGQQGVERGQWPCGQGVWQAIQPLISNGTVLSLGSWLFGHGH